MTSSYLLRFCAGLLRLSLFLPLAASTAEVATMAVVDRQIAAHPQQSGIYVLESAEEALIARAWLADHAQQSIEVQYFIWSTDNIGILAAEAVLRAAERGVRVRILVDDLLIDAPDKTLLALAQHPNIDIRIYNPKSSVGVPLTKRIANIFTDFRGLNQRMHDKTFIVDGRIAITGGRNMAAEYFDYNHRYNFRDRDALLIGDVVRNMQTSFEDFWSSRLSSRVEDLYNGSGAWTKKVLLEAGEAEKIYAQLHFYARSPDNFAPHVRETIASTPASFVRLAAQMTWGSVQFISDRPGKNDDRFRMNGGGRTTSALARLIENARTRVVIQSPYLVVSDEAKALLRRARDRGVRIQINTNSLASTDNLQAFSGYRNDRRELLQMGLEIYEYKPDPAVRPTTLPSTSRRNDRVIFGLHAKTLVVDSSIAYIGTFNLDPRSENLNTEVGAIVRDAKLARAVEEAIESDMQPANSWNARSDKPDSYASLLKRIQVWFWQLLPIKPLL